MTDVEPGTYALLLKLDRKEKITVGKLGTFDFPASHYLYVGSALGPGGLRARLARHRRVSESPSQSSSTQTGKKLHWHIDYLLRRARAPWVRRPWPGWGLGEGERGERVAVGNGVLVSSGVGVAVGGTALLEVGAVGLGTLLTIALGSTAADLTGILAASLLAAVGLFIIPAKRRRAKADLRAKIEDMKGRLMATMTAQFEREMERSLHRLEEAIAPYTRFVRAEQEKLGQLEGKLKDTLEALKVLRVRVTSS